ncbi:MAG: nucleotide exchange factor GrpE [Prolixibacteraceae bacterium]|nr:nucleotide exchange factor GrpE [Prolixibacteraceae bacterium]
MKEENKKVNPTEKELKEEAAEEKQSNSKKSKKDKKQKDNEKIKELEEVINQKNDQFIRLQAEFDNYRKRTLKEKMELTKSAGENLLLNILPLVDDFERALNSMNESDKDNPVKQGLDLIYKRFIDFLSQNGVKEIEAIGQEFDTDLHEAITKIPAPSEELKGKIVDVVQKGYMLNDKVIRYAKVVIGE